MAKITCDNDADCVGILDQSCDYKGQGLFLLCRKGIVSSETYESSCMFHKKEYFGMNLVQIIFYWSSTYYFKFPYINH